AMAAPAESVENAPIAERLGVSERWIVDRTGVERRRIAAPGERLASYAAEAGDRALGAAGVDATEIDLVLVATMSHEQLTPHAASLVAVEVGASSAGALDVSAACTGFLSALSMGTSQIESGRADSVLVIGADLTSRLTNRDDRSTAGLFGDGAGAFVLRPAEAPGRIGPVVLGADGGHAGLIQCDRDGMIRMKGPDTFRQAVDRLSQATVEALAAADRVLGDVDVFAYHQANSRIIRAVGERLELPADRVLDYVAGYGNTSAASIPIALAEAREAGLLDDGTTVLCAAFGGGLAWGGTVIDWGGDGD
ncbi:MAG: 3-oxoacyl-ACP synthase III family protein, partial [Solirubrobacterales bacterium]